MNRQFSHFWLKQRDAILTHFLDLVGMYCHARANSRPHELTEFIADLIYDWFKGNLFLKEINGFMLNVTD